MAGELQAPYLTGRTVYAVVRNAVGEAWNTDSEAFEAYQTANYADYAIALTEQGTAGQVYAGDMPAAAAGVYGVTVHDQAGGSPAEGDLVVGAGSVEWDGTVVASVASRLAAEDYVPATTAAIADKLLGRSIAGGADGGRTVSQALAASRNRVVFDVPAAGQFTVMADDDVTPLWTGTYARGSAGLGPVTDVNPA